MKFKYILAGFTVAIAFLVVSCISGDPVDDRPMPKSVDESSCSMPMCESLGGHDAIALQVMFGD